ncbi:hypothetical protein CFC21_105740 [Triticum aestivum]|uniref:Uncharacterized protein n=2 Tax=Triticum aestivum TaxID=4565 RepID=A0A9R1N8U0_WHEAT|nr:hypothetical protein CFC21_105740 [Triticum aestivum]
MTELVATIVVGPLLSIVKDKASSYHLDKYKVMNGMEEQHKILKRKLPAILDIITDAEQTAAHREGATAWLEEVKTVAYQANEVFDEFKYEALRREAKKEGHYNKLGFDVVKLFPTHNRFIFRNRTGRKLRKIVQDIEVLVAEMNAFGFKYQQRSPLSTKLRQTDHVIFDPEKITIRSREKDYKNIINILVGQANNADLTVVPIVGMGGLGKTTLAQLVYNEPEIEKHFDVLLWVCVSECFDADSLARSIVEAALEKKDNGTEAAPRKKRDDTEASTDSKKKTLLDSLQHVVSGQRYLLVWDDIWARQVHIWEQLKACLQHGGMGSVILTTSRDGGVAETMGTVEAYNLTALENKFIKEIIETSAFSCLHKEEERPIVLVDMVDEIVKRCRGSPLAATALGTVLRTKTNEEEWKAVLSRSNVCTEESGILPILKLSYNDLPSYMKQCFAFCAIFPKDYEIDVDKLIQLWIANGFIIQEKHVRLETIAKQIFNQLASRTTCRIHDLMHDVALSVMEKECALATEETSKIECVVATEEPSQTKSSSLQHLAKCSSLQAFQLCSYKSSFPLKSKYLHHLRYLDLSRSYIKALPEDMSILYNLQTLNLSGCKYLCGLPSQMKYMTALRHLFTHGCPQLKSMPRDLRKLTALQTLTCFVVVSGSNCSNVGELRNLNLGGQLELHHLANVTEKDAKAANLIRKNELRELTLRWTVGQDHFSRETSHEDDARVLEKLKPHNGLRAIRIYSYRATTFPTGMAMLQNIVEIHVCHCKKLQWLFSRNSDTSFAFPNLKELTLDSLVSLERWWEINNDVIQREEIMFPRLEKLCISQCEKLTALPGQPTFPNLQNACIERCPEYLTTRVKSPNLSVLTMQGREIHVFQWVARHMTSLINLELHSLEDSTETTSGAAEHGLREVLTFDGKKNWRGQDFPLAVLVLVNFRSGVTELCACFVHLQGLRIWGCALVHWPAKEFQGLVFLRRLQIECCDDLTGYAQASAELSTSPETTLQLLPRLESLEIRKCDNLVEVFNVPASQRRMIICDCSKLESPFGRRLQQGQSAPSIHQGSSSVLEVQSSSSPGAGAEHLQKLRIESCHGLTGVLHLPQSLKDLEISYCVGLTSLGSCSGELPSLERLYLASCNIVSSLPDGPQAYSSLQELVIVHCPAMKTLPASLQQQLCSLQREHVDAHYYGNVYAVVETQPDQPQRIYQTAPVWHLIPRVILKDFLRLFAEVERLECAQRISVRHLHVHAAHYA